MDIKCAAKHPHWLPCRVSFENVVLRAVANTGDRSIVSFGPACDYIRLEDCELGGFSGLILPSTKPVCAA